MSNMFSITPVGRAAFSYPYDPGYSMMFSYSDAGSLSYATGASQTDTDVLTLSLWHKQIAQGGNGTFASNYEDATSYAYFKVVQGYMTCQFYQNNSGSITDIEWEMQSIWDPTGWQHLVLSFDTSEAVAADRVSLHINNVEQTGTYNNNIGLNENVLLHNVGPGATQYVGDYPSGGATYHASSIYHDYIIVDGQRLAPTNFGKEKSGIWVPIDYTGTYGDNGVRLQFTNSSDLGEDSSGNNNDFTVNNFTSANQTEDRPQDQHTVVHQVFFPEGWNTNKKPDLTDYGGTYLEEGAGTVGYCSGSSIITPGAWYFEAKVIATDNASATGQYIGISTDSPYDSSFVLYGAYGRTYEDSGWVDNSWDSYTDGDVIGVWILTSIGRVYFFKNKVQQGYYDTSPTIDDDYRKWRPEIKSGEDSSVTAGWEEINFGQLPWYDSPTGAYEGLYSSRKEAIDETSYLDGTNTFKTINYTGTGAEKAVDVGWQPNFVMIKSNDEGTTNYNGRWIIYDDVRGATYNVKPNRSDVEETDAQGLKSFDATGFTLGNDDRHNYSGDEFTAHCGRLGTHQGFEVVTYTGTGVARTVGHNLSQAPQMMWIKNRDQADDWAWYHQGAASSPEDYVLNLNQVDARSNDATAWNDTAPTSSVFTVGTSSETNASGEDYVAYLWHETPLIRIGSYIGNGSQGPLCLCDFRPQLVMIKSVSAVGDTVIVDTTNQVGNAPDGCSYKIMTNGAEATGTQAIDIFSQGFRPAMSYSTGALNTSGVYYVYFAIGDQPGKYANARG